VEDSAGIGAVAVLMLGLLAVLYYQRGGSPTQAQPAASPAVEGWTIDGIRCETMEHALFHVHAHPAIYAAGEPRPVPSGIGTPDANVQQTPQGPFVAQGSCFHWLHSHTDDGVIHVESPVQRTFTLGDYFDVWGLPLSSSRVGGETGPVIAYVNGQRYEGDPRAILLGAHAVIQLDFGGDLPPVPYTFQAQLRALATCDAAVPRRVRWLLLVLTLGVELAGAGADRPHSSHRTWAWLRLMAGAVAAHAAGAGDSRRQDLPAREPHLSRGPRRRCRGS